MDKQVRIDWNYEGKNDFSSGTGAEPAEKALGLAAAFVVPVFVAFLLWRGAVQWTWPETIVALALAFDIGGGLVSNALNSCKRFYHTPPKPQEGRAGKLLKHPMLFTVLHIHPIAVGLLHGSGNWLYGGVWYALLLVSATVVLLTPLYLQRPAAMLTILVSILLNFYAIPPVAGFEWLMPLLFVKIVYGHLVREEPYRKSV